MYACLDIVIAIRYFTLNECRMAGARDEREKKELWPFLCQVADSTVTC